MCLIAFALDAHEEFALLVAANRDEFYDREAAPAAWWSDRPEVYGGRDCRAGGSWLAVDRNGRVAAVTNVREPVPASGARSRGELVGDFVGGSIAPSAYAASVLARANDYAGFNLLLFDLSSTTPALFVSNRGPRRLVTIDPGVHGLSNGALDADWPKVRRLSACLSQAMREAASAVEAALLPALADRSRPTDDELPDTGVGLDRERALAPAMIVLPELGYGTRASSILAVRRNGQVEMLERSWSPEDPSPRVAADRRVRFFLPVSLAAKLRSAKEGVAS